MSLIVPVVYSEILRESFLGKVKLAGMAQNLGILKNTTEGDTVSFPKYKALSDAQVVIKGTQSAIDEMEQVDNKAVIKMIDKIVRIYDIDDMTALGNSIQEANSQQAIVLARKLDTDLMTVALTSPLKSATVGANAITADEINAGILKFGDEQDTDTMCGILINSLVSASFYNMPEFVGAGRTDTVQGNGIVVNGVIGYFRGIPVVVSDKGTYDSVKAECITLIVKVNALSYMEKKVIDVKEEREEKYHCSDVIGTYIYAVALTNDAGVVVIRKTIV
ncbi:hypothetical protein LL033_11970 [Clostridium estertheticum]|uniref:hypothetical protein n=1 Tax=Clostridium estertheticum TaxID=238834 RepID=UPI001C0D1B05|nr:hypothetical protein [Clostridium estertheticum]MBU3215868.1 hypothetical protein [Clostridium estertheticum]WAG57824.1 hypothetical protein LL033_11970 [Clostridium estertheticum]